MAEWKKIIVSGSGVAQLSNDANYLTDYTVTSGDVTAHEGDITITESQISDLGTYLEASEVSAFGGTLIDDANAAAARTTLGVDAAGTDNSTDVTLANTNYLSISGQEITGGTVPVTSGGTGATSAGTARTNLGLGTAAVENTTAFATAAQGGRADTALQDISGESVTDLTDVSSAGSGQIITAAERGSIGALNTFTGSLNANFATDAEVSAVSGALAADISAIDTAVPAITSNGSTPSLNSGITAAEVRSTIGVDAAGTDNSTDVTLANTNYLSLSGQEITGGTVPVASGGTGATSAAAARTALGVDAAGTDNSTDVTLANTNYLSISGQEITGGTVPVASGGTGATTAGAARTALGVDAAGTDNSTDVTLAGNSYLSISGQTITAGTVDISSHTNLGVSDTTGQTGINLTLSGDNISGVLVGLKASDSPTFADLTVTGDLTVSGTTTTVDTTNLNVTDQFINLNDGGSAADGGLVVEGAGVSFGWDNSEARWAFDAADATEGQTTISADAYASAVVTSDLAAYRKNGNIRVTGGDIFIYTE